MKFFEKLLSVLSKNIGYTVVLVVAIVLFLVSSEGHIIYGAVTAISAMIGYVCARALYLEYKNASTTTTKTKKKKTGK